MRDLISLMASLERAQGGGYGTRRIPDPLDDLVSAVLERWRSATDAERAEVQGVMTLKVGWLLVAYGERMASLAVRSIGAVFSSLPCSPTTSRAG